MPREAREKSKSGYYHILLRGIGRQNIFEDNEDNIRFLETIIRYRQEMQFEIHAYCLMGNHVHLLLKDADNQLNLIMKRIACSYAYYFNRKYDRVGHLFQDRFKSEAIEDDAYYLTVLRYIHQNPLKAGIATVDDYEWSSYKEYKNNPKIVETKFALELLDGITEFIEFVHSANDDLCLEIKESQITTDKRAKEILLGEYQMASFMEIQKLQAEERNAILAGLKENGISIRQIARLTGINRGVVQKA